MKCYKHKEQIYLTTSIYFELEKVNKDRYLIFNITFWYYSIYFELKLNKNE